MKESKTCGNCDGQYGCRRRKYDPMISTCDVWRLETEPIPVSTTTDAKTELQNAIYKYTGQKPDEYPTKQETEDAYVYLAKKGLVVDQKYHGYMLAMHDAIAKRDDLLRRMAIYLSFIRPVIGLTGERLVADAEAMRKEVQP